MAWTNIKDEVLPRAHKIAGIMGCSDREALGTAAMLWRDSQDVLATSGTYNDIVDWAHLYVLEEEEAARWVAGLEKARFISRTDDGEYLIRGNEEAIEKRVRGLERCQKGGDATRRKWEAIREAKAKLKLASGRPEEGYKPSTSYASSQPEAGHDLANVMEVNGTKCSGSSSRAPARETTTTPTSSVMAMPKTIETPPPDELQTEEASVSSECLWGDPDIVDTLREHGIDVRGQRRWVKRAHLEAGLDATWVEAELHNAIGQWPSSRFKQEYRGPGGFALYFNRWLTRALERLKQTRLEIGSREPDTPPEVKATYYGSAPSIPDEEIEWGEDEHGNRTFIIKRKDTEADDE